MQGRELRAALDARETRALIAAGERGHEAFRDVRSSRVPSGSELRPSESVPGRTRLRRASPSNCISRHAPSGATPDRSPTRSLPEGTDTIPEIDHIVVVMQENHSFDNYLGMLGRGDGFTPGPPRPTDEHESRPERRVRPRLPRDGYEPGRPRHPELGRQPPAVRRWPQQRLHRSREQQRLVDGVLHRRRDPLLLLAGQDLPPLRSLLLLGPGPDLPESPIPAVRYRLRPHRHRHLVDHAGSRRTGPSSTASMRTTSAGRATPPTSRRST